MTSLLSVIEETYMLIRSPHAEVKELRSNQAEEEQMRHILIVEDDAKIIQLLKDYLEVEGFRVSSLKRGDQVVPFLKNHPPDALLLDIMLPGMDGMEVCRTVRRFSTIPILMLTARVEESDRLLGLDLGADDYICKPFSPREVVARVKAILRRLQPLQEEKILRAGKIELHEKTRQVTVCGQLMNLTPIEFGLLNVMMARPNQIFPRNQLIDYIWGDDFGSYGRTVDAHLKNLRKKIAAILPDQDVIHSVYGVGYKLQVTGLIRCSGMQISTDCPCLWGADAGSG